MHEAVQSPALGTRCLLYARVSTKKQQEAGNLDRPLGRLTAFAAEQHWPVVAALTDVASGSLKLVQRAFLLVGFGYSEGHVEPAWLVRIQVKLNTFN